MRLQLLLKVFISLSLMNPQFLQAATSSQVEGKVKNFVTMARKSKNFKSLVEKTLPDKSNQRRKDLLRIIKENNLKKIPLLTHHGSLLKIYSQGVMTQLRILNPKTGAFKLNGKLLNLNNKDSVASQLDKIHKLLNQPQSSFLFNLSLPQAHALIKITIGVLVLVIHDYMRTYKDCNTIVKKIRKLKGIVSISCGDWDDERAGYLHRSDFKLKLSNGDELEITRPFNMGSSSKPKPKSSAKPNSPSLREKVEDAAYGKNRDWDGYCTCRKLKEYFEESLKQNKPSSHSQPKEGFR